MRSGLNFLRNVSRSKRIVAFGVAGLVFGASDKQFHPNFLQPWKIEHPEPVLSKSEVQIARKVHSPVDQSGLNLRLYQYQSCPFCCKVRAFLDYYGFSYEVVEVNSVSRKQIKFSDYKKVPILVAKSNAHDTQMNDSTLIVSILGTYLTDPKKSLDDIFTYYPMDKTEDKRGKISINCMNKYFIMYHDKIKNEKKFQSLAEERHWREWVDNTFIHVISPNIYGSLSESMQTLNWFSSFGEWERLWPDWERLMAVYLGAGAMYFIGARLKKKYNLKPDVRESLYDACNEWMEGVGEHRRFMGGNEPNLADLSLYGAITAFEGCQAFSDMVSNTNIGTWFQSMQEAVNSHQGANEFARSLENARNN